MLLPPGDVEGYLPVDVHEPWIGPVDEEQFDLGGLVEVGSHMESTCSLFLGLKIKVTQFYEVSGGMLVSEELMKKGSEWMNE